MKDFTISAIDEIAVELLPAGEPEIVADAVCIRWIVRVAGAGIQLLHPKQTRDRSPASPI